MTASTTIVFPIFPGVTQLDFTGPFQVLSRLPDVVTVVASLGGVPVEASGLTFANLAALEAIDRCDVICMPGGNAGAAIGTPALLAQIRRLGQSARYVTSVCTGSLILGAAGLLQGRRAACHWAYRDLLPLFGAIPDPRRVVRDGNVFSGGGVTAGIDFALTLAAELAGPLVAQVIQLGLEYAPEPPFGAGRPEAAEPEVLAQARERLAPVVANTRAAVERVLAATA